MLGRIKTFLTFILLFCPDKIKPMKSTLPSLIIFFGIIIFVSCSPQKTSIAILHTNDVHGKLNNFAKLAALKDSLKTYYDTVLLVSAGDIFSGNAFVDYHEEKGYPIIKLMNAVGYNLSCLGNHEFDYGQDILIKRLREARFPVLCANLENSNTAFDTLLHPRHRLNFKGVTIDFSGYIETQNNGLPSTHPDRVKGLNFINHKEIIDRTDTIKNPRNLVLINHLGFKSDSIIATKTPIYHVIIGGHSHTLVTEKNQINNTLVVQAGDNLEHVGLVELTFLGNELTYKNYKLISLEKLENEDREIKALTKSFYNNSPLLKNIGFNKTAISRAGLGALLCDAQKEKHQLDFVFQNYYGIRVDSLATGAISKATVYEIDPFNNELLTIKLNYQEMKELIAYGYNRLNKPDLFISGGTYTIYLDRNKQISEININDANGNILKSGKEYRVGMNSYMANSYKFPKRNRFTPTGTSTADNTIEFLILNQEIDYSNNKRVFTDF